jgi:UDP-N-acetylmuramoylalanine--D-glutamate ligase
MLKEAAAKGVPIWSEIEVAYRISKAPIIAITGTNGKSTVTALTWYVLNECEKNAVLCGNIAGSGYPEMPITTAAQQSAHNQVLVAEVSSYQLEFIDQFRPHVCSITNIGEDHIDRHGSVDAYASTKRRIYENQTVEDFAIINQSRPETVAPGMKATILRYNGENPDFDTTAINEQELWSPGRHNVDNAATAWLIARTQGCDDVQIEKAIREFKGLKNRMEQLGEHNGFRFVNNTMCTNPEALRASIESCPGTIVLIAGGVLDNRDLSPISQIESDRIRASYLIGTDAERLAELFPQGAVVVNDLTQAFQRAVEIAEPGDTVLLAPGCKSFDQYHDFIERGDSFRELVHEYIGKTT